MSKQNLPLQHYSLLLIIITTFSILHVPVNSLTHPNDKKALKDLKIQIVPNSIPAGSCLTSWDFTVDPCDRVFSDRFTCGFRCDTIVSGFSRVTEITLDSVGYSGSLSNLKLNLPYLQTLDITGNSFTGSIPDSLSSLTRLRRLDFSHNSFSGEIPDSLASLSLLEELYLDNNHLTGAVPTSFNRLVSLKRLEIQHNGIHGQIPTLSSLISLAFLDLSDNRISGQVPSSLPESLVEISIRNNEIEGKLSQNLGRLVSLQVLDASHNRLSGEVPSSLFDHSSLQQITLSHNNLTSLQSPPDSRLNESRLIAIDLSFNRIGGFLPAFMPKLPKLSALSLEHNRFTGMIPSHYALKAAAVNSFPRSPSPAGDMSSFERLLLGGNYLFGLIPGALTGLKPGSADISLVDNCLYRCPDSFFFCRGKTQKSLVECRKFVPFIQ